MVRKKLLLLLILLLLAFNVLGVLDLNTKKVSAGEYPAIYIEPAATVDPTLTPGSNYTISIKTNYTGDDIWAWQFTLYYDPDILHGGINTTDTWTAPRTNTWIVDKVGKTRFYTDLRPVVENSEEVYVNGSLMTKPTEYTMDYTKGKITFATAPGVGAEVKVTYVYLTNVFYTTLKPVVKDSEEIYVNQTLMTKPANYTIDYTNGIITFTKALGLGTEITAIYLGNGVTNGDLITQDKYFAATFTHGKFNNNAGNLSLTTGFFKIINYPVFLTAGPGTLANVTFTVVGYGTSNITLGDRTQLIGYTKGGAEPPEGETYYIIKADEMPDHIQHGSFDNTGAPEVHDVAVKDISAPAETIAGKNVTINVEIKNKGTEDETVNVTVSYDTTLIGFNDTVVLPAGSSSTVSFSWGTPTVIANTTYTITAEVPPVTGETYTADNTNTRLIKLVVRHDVSIEGGLKAPTTAVVGEVVTINVTVVNEGSFEENVTVIVEYSGVHSGQLNPENFMLKGLTNNTVLFGWDTTGLDSGQYTIMANATIPSDDDPDDNDEDCDLILMLGHDVRVYNIEAPPYWVFVGKPLDITVYVTNDGGYDETFKVKVTYDTNIIGESQPITLSPEKTAKPLFTWDTTDVAPGIYGITAEAIIDEDVTPLNNNLTKEFKVESPPGTITGIVTDDSTGEPIKGATVEAVGPKTKSNTTDADGHYMIADVPPGTYTVTVSADGYYSDSKPATVESEEITPVDFSLTPLPPGMGAIAGTATDASTGDPIEGANVTANSYFDITDADGYYSITIEPGTYTVTASMSGYYDSVETDISVTKGVTTPVDFALQLIVGWINGTVTDASTEEPIEGANVTANSYSDITDTEGHYSIELPPGNYTVEASKPSYISKSTFATAVGNETTPVDFSLTPLPPGMGAIAGTVTDASTEEPIEGATITVNDYSTTTNADGYYSITIAPGTYTVNASATGYESASQHNIIVVAEETTTVDFELTPVQPVQPLPLNILLLAGVAATAIIIIAAAFYFLRIRKPKPT